MKLDKEKWYGTKHNVEVFSPDLLKKMKEPNVDVSKLQLDLPLENTLIPENLDVLPKNPKMSGKPYLLK